MRNEITDLLIEELEKYGLKGYLEDRSKHIEVYWLLPNGERRFTIVPRTASDWRSGMNSRSDLRKMLRADNVSLKQDDVRSFNRAMSMPKETVVTQVARDRAIQRDIETLSDLVLELQEQNTQLMSQVSSMHEKMNSIQVVSTVMSNVSFVDQQVVEQPQVGAKPLFRGERVSSIEVIYNLMTFVWMSRAEILERSGLNHAVASQCLLRLRKRGLVENGQRGQWRKIPNDNVTLLRSGSESTS